MIATIPELLFTSSILIAAILLLRRLLGGRIGARAQYALWLAVALRLLLPFSLPASSSVMNIPALREADRFITERVIYLTPDTAAEPAQEAPSTEPETKPVSAAPSPLFLLWAAGTLVTGGWFLSVNLRFSLRLHANRVPLEDIPPECPLPVYRVEGLASPCLFGLFHPAIYLTPQTADDPTLRRYALAHEYCHKRQGDPFWSLLRVICLALYWFHPLVWVAAICSREDCERACDARVIRLLGEEERLAYGRTLLQLVRIRQGVWQLGHTATTMIAGKRGLRARIERIAAAHKVSIPALLALLLCLSLLARCTFTGRLHLTADEALDALEGSITYESGILTFTLPAGYTEGEDWNILVAGRVAMGDTGGGMSVHLFEEENSQHSWVPGRAYSIDLNETHYLELLLDASLPDGDGTAERSIDLLAIAGGGPIDSAVETNGGADGPEDVTVEGYNTVYITFPAYQDGRTDANAFLYDTTPFTAHLLLPESWEVRLPDTEHRTGGALWTPVEIFDGGRKVGTLGFNRYEAYEGIDELPEAERYKTIYYELRLGRLEVWDPYTPVHRYAEGESGIATVNYMDPAYLAEHPDTNWAAVPALQTTGILCNNDTLLVYAGLRFEADYPIDETDLQIIAESFELLPDSSVQTASWDFGPTGKRYPGGFSPLRDYSGIEIRDAAGNDITGILIDLWYCASEAYNVDDNLLFSIGEEAVLDEGMPAFWELLDYDKTVAGIFTPNALAQYETSDVVRITKTDDGRVWRLGPWRTGYSYGYALTDLEPVEVSDNRMVVLATYEENAGYAGALDDPSYLPSYRTVDFTVLQSDGIWYVDDYTYPESAH